MCCQEQYGKCKQNSHKASLKVKEVGRVSGSGRPEHSCKADGYNNGQNSLNTFRPEQNKTNLFVCSIKNDGMKTYRE
jgi:hypothetical protein